MTRPQSPKSANDRSFLARWHSTWRPCRATSPRRMSLRSTGSLSRSAMLRVSEFSLWCCRNTSLHRTGGSMPLRLNVCLLKMESFSRDLARCARPTGARYWCLNVEEVDGRLYPTSFLVGPEGKVLLSYRKVHLFADERSWASAGFDYPVSDTPFGRIGNHDGL
ncbi:nitrilase-related carbon-nitrogen hydrolase [Bradyrhizobium sp. BR 1433]|uniref:nitrilase-related carbon-nitrogen hydrolase n=1 Tax=Bradyrhizobium sp. BR 1433 TaxID=3447967 RepID=UPI003EE4B714